MDIQMQINTLFPDTITKLTKEHCLCRSNRLEKYSTSLESVIDGLGVASFKAQNLPKVVTSLSKLKNSDHRMYVLRDPNAEEFGARLPFGFIKVGKKNLFLFDCFGQYYEVEPVCILDFYVSPQYQRKGHGKVLFKHMLKEENLTASQLPIDTPSEKMLNFMSKHFHLDKPIKQSNYFVVYQKFFNDVGKFLVNPRNSRKPTTWQPSDHFSSAELQEHKKQTAVNRSKSSIVRRSISLPHVPDMASDSIQKSQLIPHTRVTISTVASGDVVDLPLSRQLDPQVVGWKGSSSHRYLSREGLTSSCIPSHPSSRPPLNPDCGFRQSNLYNYRQAVRASYKHTRLW